MSGKDAWVKYFQSRGLSKEQAQTAVDTVDLSDGLSQEEATTLGLEAEGTIDRYIRQGWAADGEAGIETEEQGVNVVEADELERAYAAIARYADAHNLSYEQAQRIYFQTDISFTRQSLSEVKAEREATRAAWVSEYNAKKAESPDLTFVDWAKERFGITDENDPVLANLQAYVTAHADATPEQLVDFILLNGFAARLTADIQTDPAEGDNPGLGLSQAVTGRTAPADYQVATLEPFYRNAPAATEEPASVETETQQAETAPPPAETTASTETSGTTEASATLDARRYFDSLAGLLREHPGMTLQVGSFRYSWYNGQVAAVDTFGTIKTGEEVIPLLQESLSVFEGHFTDGDVTGALSWINGQYGADAQAHLNLLLTIEGYISGGRQAYAGVEDTGYNAEDYNPASQASQPSNPPVTPNTPSAPATVAQTTTMPEQITIDAGELFRQGEEAFGRGEYQQAIDLYQTAFDNLPGGRPLMEMARCQIALGRAEEARATLARLRSEYPNFVAFPAYDEYVSGLEASLSLPSVTQTAPQEARLDEPPPTAPPPPPSTPAPAAPVVAEPSPENPVDITQDIAALQAPAVPIVSPEPEIVPEPEIAPQPSVVAEAPAPPPPPPATLRQTAGESLAQLIAAGDYNLISITTLLPGPENFSLRGVLTTANNQFRNLGQGDPLKDQFKAEYIRLLSEISAVLKSPDTTDDQAVIDALNGLNNIYYAFDGAEMAVARGDYSRAIAAYEGIENPPAFITARLEALKGLRDTAAAQQTQLADLRAKANVEYQTLLTYVSDNGLNDQDLTGNLAWIEAEYGRLDSTQDPAEIQKFIDSLPGIRTMGEQVIARRESGELTEATVSAGTESAPPAARVNLGDIPTIQLISANPQVPADRVEQALRDKWQTIADKFNGIAGGIARRNTYQYVIISGYIEFNPSTGRIRWADVGFTSDSGTVSDFATLQRDANGDGRVEEVGINEAVADLENDLRFTADMEFTADSHYQDVGGGWYRYNQRMRATASAN